MATDFTKGMSPPPANHRIKRILQNYQQTADRSLNGPCLNGGGGGGLRIPVAVYRGGEGPGFDPRTCRGGRPVVSRDHGLAGRDREHGPWKRPGGPVMEPSRSCVRSSLGRTDMIETILEGERIAGFEVGGEQRLCMPQILSTVLRDFDPAQVFEVCEELHIFFSRCTPEQLRTLIRTKILPPKVTTCGLITYTNAERMCSTLLRNQAAYKYRLPVAIEGLKVYHECFGGCRGVFMPEAFEFPAAKCVQCAECGEMFAPAQFVSHSHSELENGTIHWGFNPVNWKSYLLLSLEQTGYPRVQGLLDSLKNKFEDGSDTKVEKIVIKQEFDDEMPVKRIRSDRLNISPAPAEDFPPKWVPADVDGAWRFCMGLCKQLDSIKIRTDTKLPPFLQTETPFLADSERVVPYTDSQWTDRNFAPNVSLDPTPYKNLHIMYDDDCDEKDPVVDDDEEVVPMATPYKWSPSATSSDVLTSQRKANSGTVSDDDSDDSESVLSDKLPAMSEDDEQGCDRISNIWNARLGLLIRALEGEVHRSASEDPLKEFLKLQEQHSDIVSSLTDNNNALSQRRLYLWTLMEDKLRAMEEVRKNQDEELAVLKQESAVKMQEAILERRRLVDQIERLSTGSVDADLAMVTQYKDEAEILRKQLRNAEEMNASLRREITELHRAIERLAAQPSSEHGLYMPMVIQSEVAAAHGVRSSRIPMPCASSSVCPQGV